MGLCVNTNGWLYVATSLGIQVLRSQAGRVNFIIPTPKQPHDVCFGGKDFERVRSSRAVSTIYKREQAKGYISGQMAPIKPPAPGACSVRSTRTAAACCRCFKYAC